MICSTCKIDKDETEFHKDKRSKTGLNITCRVCRSVISKKYKLKYRDRILAESREYAKNKYQENPEKYKERHRLWKENNPEVLADSNKKSCKKGYWKFREKRLAYFKIYREIHAEEKKYRDSAWRLKNPDKVKEYGRISAARQRVNAPHKVKARMLVSYAIEIGHLIRPSNCSRCLKECKPEGHHPDYSMPLEVEWVCRECHNIIHGKCKRDLLV